MFYSNKTIKQMLSKWIFWVKLHLNTLAHKIYTQSLYTKLNQLCI